MCAREFAAGLRRCHQGACAVPLFTLYFHLHLLACMCLDLIQEEYGKKKEKIQFRLCTSCKNEIRHSVGLYIELDFLLPRYNFSTWLISLLSKTYNNMCQTSRPAPSPRSGGGVDGNADLKNVRLKKFAVAGHWMDSMADWLWRDRQLQLDNT